MRAGDPFETPTSITPTPTQPWPTTPADPTQCEHITSQRCGEANTGLIGSAVGYSVTCVLLFYLLRVFWSKRGTTSPFTVFVVTLLLATGAAATLVYFDPIRGQDLQCCLAHGVFKAEVLLQDSVAGRAALFGAAPTASVFFLVTALAKKLRG